MGPWRPMVFAGPRPEAPPQSLALGRLGKGGLRGLQSPAGGLPSLPGLASRLGVYGLNAAGTYGVQPTGPHSPVLGLQLPLQCINFSPFFSFSSPSQNCAHFCVGVHIVHTLLRPQHFFQTCNLLISIVSLLKFVLISFFTSIW
jgi:hypothetical protein